MWKQPLGVLALDNLFQISALRLSGNADEDGYGSFDVNLVTLVDWALPGRFFASILYKQANFKQTSRFFFINGVKYE